MSQLLQLVSAEPSEQLLQLEWQFLQIASPGFCRKLPSGQEAVQVFVSDQKYLLLIFDMSQVKQLVLRAPVHVKHSSLH